MSFVVVAGQVYRQVAEREIREVHAYDFDNCLFLSPDKPDWWPHRHWWTHPDSLLPPCVPEKPGGGWWNSDVVAAAKESIDDDTVYTLMITGRVKDEFSTRITELLKQKDLLFDELRFKQSPKEDTPSYKSRHIRAITKKFPEGLDQVQVWDDQRDNLDEVENYLGERGVTTIVHHVEGEMHKVDCSEEAYEKKKD